MGQDSKRGRVMKMKRANVVWEDKLKVVHFLLAGEKMPGSNLVTKSRIGKEESHWQINFLSAPTAITFLLLITQLIVAQEVGQLSQSAEGKLLRDPKRLPAFAYESNASQRLAAALEEEAEAKAKEEEVASVSTGDKQTPDLANQFATANSHTNNHDSPTNSAKSRGGSEKKNKISHLDESKGDTGANLHLLKQLLRVYPSQRNAQLVRELAQAGLDFQLFFASPQVDRERRQATSSHEKERQADTFVLSTAIAAGQQNKANKLASKANQVLGHYNRTNVVIKAFNYKFRLDLELNNNLFGPSLIQKHFLPKGGQQISTQKIEHCFYHARTQPDAKPVAIGAFRTCNGLSGIIHVNNESFVVHPFYDIEQSKKHPHIIYRYQTAPSSTQQRKPPPSSSSSSSSSSSLANQLPAANQPGDSSNYAGNPVEESTQPGAQVQSGRRECGNSRLHEWALRQYNKLSSSVLASTSSSSSSSASSSASLATDRHQRQARALSDSPAGGSGTGNADGGREPNRFSKRDISLTEKHIELALILSEDFFDKRNLSSRLEVLHDAIQIINCLDLYFKSANTRVALIYVETWAHGDQLELSSDVKQSLYNLVEYSTRKLYKVSMDAVHLLTGGHARQFEANEVGMSIPDSICSSRAVSLSQEAGIFEPFITATTIAHMLGHNLGMEHDETDDKQAQVEEAEEEAYDYEANSEANSTLESANISTTRRLSSDLNPATNNSSQEATNPGQQPNKATANQRHLPHQQPQVDDVGGEEHEDEIKSRSVGQLWLPAQRCLNCIMSPHIAYIEPPVLFGNMILQQVASGESEPANSSHSLVTLINVDQSGAKQGPGGQGLEQGSLTSANEQLNGQTMNQIDSQIELQSTASGGGSNQQRRHELKSAFGLPYRFSRQSILTYHRLLRLGHGICLFNKPNQLEDFKSCGNGIVDKGEDCDCGTFQECLENLDSCCDPITCRFKADAECITGACCDRCRLRQRGFVCRKARGECDLEETCDGKSGQCAPDVHKQNGFPCSQANGYCHLGQCPQLDQQCSELWGSDARKADRLCYAYNSNGTVFGNCGPIAGPNEQAQTQASSHHHHLLGGRNKFKRCEHADFMCGTLQCQLGDMKPITASGNLSDPQTEFSKKILHGQDGGRHECKVIIAGAGAGGSQLGGSKQLSSFGYARDGSKCGPNRVCFNQTCLPIEQVYRDSFELCPLDEKGRQCSGNGVCSTANRCHCEPAWTGRDCSQRWPVQQPPQPQQALMVADHYSRPSGAGSMLRVLADRVKKPSIPSMSIVNVFAEQNFGQTQLQANQPVGASPTPAANEQNDSTTTATTSGQVAQTSEPPPVSSTVQPTSAPISSVASSNVVVDKKKHDALGAPTLVLILVSIVAAVYLGFALMANCYRRKGFIKPDKVLRHHQMNCKLDAIRSSLIAKRLAGVEVVTAALENNSSTSGQAALASGPADLMGNFLLPQQQFQAAQQQQQHQLSTIYNPNNRSPADCLSPLAFDQSQSAQRADKSFMNQRQQFSVHQQSFDDQFAERRPEADYFRHRFDSNYAPNYIGPANDQQETGDHIPLLFAEPSDSVARAQRELNPLRMRSFAGARPSALSKNNNNVINFKKANVIYQDNWPTSARGQQVLTGNTNQRLVRQLMVANAGAAQINRATSLGNVNRQASQQLAREQDYLIKYTNDEDQEGASAEELRRTMISHRALATPLRSRLRRPPAGQLQGEFELDDSCSGSSSPGHRDSCWSEAAAGRAISLSRQASGSRLVAAVASLAGQSSAGYHEETILGALSGGGSQRRPLGKRLADTGHQFDDKDLPPLPPPPLPPSTPLPGNTDTDQYNGNHNNNHDADTEDGEAPSEDDEASDQSRANSQLHPQANADEAGQKRSTKRRSEPTLSRSPNSGFRRTVRRVPLNNGGAEVSEQQLSLISQLQQLERVQSLHKKQVASERRPSANNGADNLHEFFSLPLSVQLSALLARSLRDSSGSSMPPIDDYLNTLNNSNVATSSRRSFKLTSTNQQQQQQASTSKMDRQLQQQQQQQQQQPAGSWAGSLKKQQIKLHNLQGLIDRLQQLQQQTLLQQQLEELNGDFEDGAVFCQGSRQSTLGRPNPNRNSLRFAQTAADDLYATEHNYRRQLKLAAKAEGGYAQGVASRRLVDRRSHLELANKNESVYSMSDSEDGCGFVSRILVSNHQKQLARGGSHLQQQQSQSSIGHPEQVVNQQQEQHQQSEPQVQQVQQQQQQPEAAHSEQKAGPTNLVQSTIEGSVPVAAAPGAASSVSSPSSIGASQVIDQVSGGSEKL